MAEAKPREKELFLQAVERSASERSAFLVQACAGDEALLRQVEALLAAHVAVDSFLEKPAAALDATEDDVGTAALRQTLAHDSVGTRIGRYRLLEQIGEGGMGIVYLAEQEEPVKRRVALKIIKPGMDSGQVLIRFEAERQALALMDHPNIATVLDAGTTDGSRPESSRHTECAVSYGTRSVPATLGRPYFVMELVKGTPITRFCDERRLAPRERLELFVLVCQAIQHAHQKGIIHRDIKPSNVLVALYDEKPVPKVIDFGVAKATGLALTEKTLHTGFGAIVGTPEYMSPEQATFNQLDIDTRSDVYALGVLLYELLTGTTPVDRSRFKEAALLEVLRVVREEEPPRPSVKLSTAQARATIADTRGVEPDRLVQLLRGELDWIVMKALEKDRNQRYETAAGLARDVERYLKDELVEARPPSAGYRLRKFVKRNRGVVTAGSLVLVTLLVGITLTTLAMWQRNDALRETTAALKRAEDLEKTARDQAEKERTARTAADLQTREANIQARRARAAQARLALERGLTLLEQGTMNHGLLWIGKSMELAPEDDVDFHRVAWLNLAAWYPRMHTAQWRQRLSTASVQFLSDPHLLVLGGGDGRVRCWNTAANREEWVSASMEGPLKALALSNDGKRLAVGGPAKITLLNPADGKVLGTSLEIGTPVLSLAFHPSENELLIGESKQARRWDLKAGQPVGVPLPAPHPVTSVSYSPDGKQCVTGCQPARGRFGDPGELVQRWERATGTRLGPTIDHPCGLCALRWLPDGSTPHWAPRVQRRVLDALGTAGRNLDISPDGRYLVTRGFDYKARIWDLFAQQKEVGQVIYQSGWTGTDWARFRPDGRATLSGMQDDLQLWDFAGVRRPRQFTLPGVPRVECSAFSPAGKTLAVFAGKEIRLLDVTTTEAFGRSIPCPAVGSFPLVVGNDERTVLFAHPSNQAQVWDAVARKARFTLDHEAGVISLALSRNGRVALTACAKGVARAWNLETGQRLGPDFSLGSTPVGVSLSNDGSLALAGAWRGFFVRAWEVASAKQLPGTTTTGGPASTHISPDGKRIAVSSWGDDRVRLGTLTPLAFTGLSLEHPRGSPNLAFSPDSQLLLTALNNELRLFDTEMGLRIGPILKCNSTILSQAFSPGGDSVVALTSNGVLHYFAVPAMVEDPQRTLPRRAVLWTQLLTGMELDAFGQAYPRPEEQLRRLREALEALGGAPANLPPTPEQIRVWHQQEARENLDARRWLVAHWHLNRLLDLDPNDQQARADRAMTLFGLGMPEPARADLDLLPDRGQNDARLMEMLGSLAQRQSQWAEAATYFARAATLDESKPALVRCQVACLLLAGDAAGLKMALPVVLERAKTPNLELVLHFYQALALVPDLRDGWEARFKHALTAWQDLWPEHVIGLAGYRAGQFDRARQGVEKSLGFYAAFPGHVNNWLLLAAIQHRRGEDAEARRWFTRATAWLDRVVAEQSAEALTPGGLALADWLECLVLRREVEDLLAGKKR